MRKRGEIEADGKRPDHLILGVLLDIRDILLKEKKKARKHKEVKTK